MFKTLNGVYEPSAVQQLQDGRFLVAEDEKEFPFSLVSIHLDGTTTATPLVIEAGAADPGKLNDLEGLAMDASGWIYATTSHSRNSQGEIKPSREKLIRFRVEGDRMVALGPVKNLKPALIAGHPELAAAAAILNVKAEGGFNIEALEFSPDQRDLLVGFRSPLDAGRALIASISNPTAMFEHNAEPVVTPALIRLDLGGQGLRGMSWAPDLGGYLLLSGPVARELTHFRLWFWGGQATDRPRPVDVDGLPGFEHAEGITPASIAGHPRYVIVSDDGSREEQRPAKYLLLSPEQLRISPETRFEPTVDG